MTDDVVEPDFALVAVKDDRGWRVDVLPARSTETLETLEEVLQATAADGLALGLIGVLDEYLLLLRREGNHSRLFLNDVAATTEWPLALDVLDRLGLPEPAEEDLERVQPVGDLALIADLGFDGAELAMVCEDLDLFNDEVGAQVAQRLGFADAYERLSAD